MVLTLIPDARIAELEYQLAKSKDFVELLKHENKENTKLIGEYETEVGLMVERIRNFACNHKDHYISLAKSYNGKLQEEKDAHLESRLDRDKWFALAMRYAGMIRHAAKLRNEEEEVPIRVVAGLQNEVRALRFAVGLEQEKPEEEYGWEILKDVPESEKEEYLRTYE